MPVFTDKIIPEKTAILVIDMINAFVAPDAPLFIETGHQLAPALGKFLHFCRKNDMQIIYAVQSYRADGADLQKNNRRCDWSQNGTRLISGTWDCEIYEACKPEEKDIVIQKQHYNAFYNTDLLSFLRSDNTDTVVITGVCTDVSCFYTAREAFNQNYKVILIEDLCGTTAWPDFGYGAVTAKEQHLAAINNLAATSAQVMSSQNFYNSVK